MTRSHADTDQSTCADMSDAELIDAMARAEPLALAEAYSRHGGAVYGMARRLYEPEHAEALTTEVFLALWHDPKPLATFAESMRGRLVGDVHRRAVAKMRLDADRRRFESDLSIEELERHLTSRWPDHIGRVLAGLPHIERQTLCFAYFGGYALSEVASITGTTHDEAKRALNSAFRLLRDQSNQGAEVSGQDSGAAGRGANER